MTRMTIVAFVSMIQIVEIHNGLLYSRLRSRRNTVRNPIPNGSESHHLLKNQVKLLKQLEWVYSIVNVRMTSLRKCVHFVIIQNWEPWNRTQCTQEYSCVNLFFSTGWYNGNFSFQELGAFTAHSNWIRNYARLLQLLCKNRFWEDRDLDLGNRFPQESSGDKFISQLWIKRNMLIDEVEVPILSWHSVKFPK